jgi:hypothetical protein
MDDKVVIKGEVKSSKIDFRKSIENRKNFNTLKSLIKKIKIKLCKSS